MIDSTSQDDLARWLDQATQGLPKSQASAIRAELAAHYEDAVEEFVRQGIPQAVASLRALAALGDPQPVARGFKEVHLGQRHYKAALFVSLLLVLVNVGFIWAYKTLNLVDYSTSSRVFYALDHLLLSVLMGYIVVVLRRLVMWHFGIPSVDTPGKIILGGIGMYALSNMILELTIDTWNPVPTAFEGANALEGLLLLIMHGALIAIWAGMFLFGMRILPARSGLLKGSAIVAILQSTLSIIALLLVYMDSKWSYAFGETSMLVSLFLWPLIGLLFFQASYTRHRLPIQTA